MDVGEFRERLEAWCDEHADELAPPGAAPLDHDATLAQLDKVKSMAWESGFMQWGWPEAVGGRGGSPLLRAVLGEVLTRRDLVQPGYFSMIEVLAPTVIEYADPELAAEMVPRLLRGAETWCQGFSEPGTGSDLASLACRAVPDGDGWRVSGQKVWTSLATHAQRCVLLTRTGPPGSRHRGITAFFVDMDSPGVTVRPIETMHGVPEFCEVFFDDVRVPDVRRLGEVDGGWAVAMDLLPYERSTCFWHRTAFLGARFEDLVAAAPDDAHTDHVLGATCATLFALRARSRATAHRLDAGETLGPETSVDKVLVATAEQELFDTAREVLGGTIEVGDTDWARRWRTEWLYSRAATIYGGTSEVQRNIIARRLLGLGEEA